MDVFEETRGSVRLEIWRDENPESPRNTEYDLGKMICFHRRYSFGDKHDYSSPDDFIHGLLTEHFGSEDKADKYERECENYDADPKNILYENNVILPIYLYDHSGVSISTTTFTGRAVHADWDSGQIGWIYADKESVIREYGEWTDESVNKAKKALAAEVKTYDDYLSGETYFYEIHDEMTNELVAGGAWIGNMESLKNEVRPLLPPEDSDEELKKLSTLLAERLITEYDEFLLEIKALSPQEIIDRAYQIVAKYDLAGAGEMLVLSKREYEALLSSSNALESLYSEWMHMDTNQHDEILDCAHYAAKSEYQYQKRMSIGGDAR